MNRSEVVVGAVGESRDGLFVIVKVEKRAYGTYVTLLPSPDGEIEDKQVLNIEHCLYAMETVSIPKRNNE